MSETESNKPVVQVCDALIDKDGQLKLWQYCTHVHITRIGSGTFIGHEDAYVFGSEHMTRSATVTFVNYKKRYFALTCRHVYEALRSKNADLHKRFKEDSGTDLADYDLYQFYTPVGNFNYHFNYEFWPVPETSPGVPDVAMTEVSEEFIKRLQRKALKLTTIAQLPTSAIAAGYPEQQRKLIDSKEVEGWKHLSISVAHCFAYLTTQSNKLILSDAIEEHHGLDNLSGMSGGPIIWSNLSGFGLIGVVTDGWDVQPKDSEDPTPSVAIMGEPITPNIFDSWLKSLPANLAREDRSMKIHFPKTEKV